MIFKFHDMDFLMEETEELRDECDILSEQMDDMAREYAILQEQLNAVRRWYAKRGNWTELNRILYPPKTQEQK